MNPAVPYTSVYARAEAIALTEMSDVANAPHAATHQRLAQATPGLKMRWSAALCSTICGVCKQLNGQVRAPGEYFSAGRFRGLRPTAHPRCRCRLVAVVPSTKERAAMASEAVAQNAPPKDPSFEDMVQKPLAQAKRLSPEALPGVSFVGNDQVLRGSTPRRVVKDVLTALQQQTPGPRRGLPAVYFNVDEANAKKAIASMVRGEASKESARDAVSRRRVNAVYLGKTIILSPAVVQKLTSNSIPTRLSAAQTLAHEWSHYLNDGIAKFVPLEEGLAEHFADRFLSQALGVARSDVPDSGAYSNFKEVFSQVARLAGGATHLEGLLRSGQHQGEVLRGILLARGVESSKVDSIIGYNTNDDEAAGALVEALRSIL